MYKFLFLLMFLMLSCAGSMQPVLTDVESHAPITGTRVVMDESFDPLTLDDFEFLVHEKRSAGNGSIQTVTAEELLQRFSQISSADSSEEIEGYRVQLMATRDEEEARAMLRNAVISFNEQVYREFDNPYYKIRIGDFKSRYDAVQLQEKALQMGFSEAWVVRSMVKKKFADAPVVEGASNP